MSPAVPNLQGGVYVSLKNADKRRNISEEAEQQPDMCRAMRATTAAVCGVAAGLMVCAVVAALLLPHTGILRLYLPLGLLCAAVVVCVVTLISLCVRCSSSRREMVDGIARRIHGAAAGDPDAAEKDAYDYPPVDEAVRVGLAAVLSELGSVRTERNGLSDRLEGISEERDEYQFRMLGARMIPGLIERAVRKIGRVADQRKINDIALFSHTLCDLMNSSMQAAKKPISLARELGLIRSYLDLDDAITGRKTEYRMTVMCSIVGYKLVPHLVLPVVENLLEYSEREKNSKYEVAIEITTDPEHMYINIRDNGRGIDVDTLEKLQSGIENNTIDLNDDPLSLPGIHRRIALCYGDECGLRVSSSKLGTSVRLTLPPKPDPFYDDEY